LADRIAALWCEAYGEGATFELVRELLQLDPTQAKVGQNGLTMLHIAAGHHCHDGAALLIACGADVNAVDDCGETPLHRAAWSLDPESCRQLLEAGADPTTRDRHGRTPLDLAVNGSMQASLAEWETTQVVLGQAWVKNLSLS